MLQRVVNDNPKSFLTFIHNNSAYTNLLNNTEGDLKKALLTNVQNSFATLFSLMGFSNPMLFKDNATRCFNSLQKLATERLNTLNTQLDAAKPKAIKVAESIFKDKDNSDSNNSLATLPIDKLQALKTNINSSKNALQNFHDLASKVELHNKRLIELSTLHNEAKNFLTTHNKWKVKISNFFAENFHSIFKSKTAKMVDKAAEIRVQVSTLEQQYSHETKAELVKLKNNPNISKEFLDQLIVSINEQQKTEHKPDTLAQKPSQQLASIQAKFKFFEPEVETLNKTSHDELPKVPRNK